jgi:outer membrane protein
MKNILSIILFACIISISYSQEILSLTIDKAVEIGLQNSKALRTSQYKVVAADAKASETSALGLPSLKFNGTYTRLSEVPASAIPNFINPSGPPIVLSPSVVNNYGLKATVQQPLFTGGENFRSRRCYGIFS